MKYIRQDSWLARSIESAAREVATWPEYKRAAAERDFGLHPDTAPLTQSGTVDIWLNKRCVSVEVLSTDTAAEIQAKINAAVAKADEP